MCEIIFKYYKNITSLSDTNKEIPRPGAAV